MSAVATDVVVKVASCPNPECLDGEGVASTWLVNGHVETNLIMGQPPMQNLPLGSSEYWVPNNDKDLDCKACGESAMLVDPEAPRGRRSKRNADR